MQESPVRSQSRPRTGQQSLTTRQRLYRACEALPARMRSLPLTNSMGAFEHVDDGARILTIRGEEYSSIRRVHGLTTSEITIPPPLLPPLRPRPPILTRTGHPHISRDTQHLRLGNLVYAPHSSTPGNFNVFAN